VGSDSIVDQREDGRHHYRLLANKELGWNLPYDVWQVSSIIFSSVITLFGDGFTRLIYSRGD